MTTGRSTNGGQMADEFWVSLVQEVQSLRDVLHEPLEDDEDAATDVPYIGQPVAGSRFISLGSQPSGEFAHLIESFMTVPTSPISLYLYEMYTRKVDPLIRILHRPSLDRLMVEGKTYLGYPHSDPSVDALISAVHLMAISVMDDSQSQFLFQVPRSVIANDLVIACESAIQRAGLIVTTDMTVLQAFTLYLVGTALGKEVTYQARANVAQFAIRTLNNGRAVWTLTAVAVRLATALNLHHDEYWKDESFFHQQMRKRLWYTLCLLDIQISFELASQPLILTDSIQPSMPANVNDADYDETSVAPIADRQGLTDMTFCLMAYNGQVSGKKLNFENSLPRVKLAEKMAIVDGLEDRFAQLILNCDPDLSDYAWLIWQTSKSIIAAMKLSIFRPMRIQQGQYHVAAGNSNVLDLCVILLEKTFLMRTDPRGANFSWYVNVKWHGLAVAVAECYACNDPTVVRWIWPMIEESFAYHMEIAMRNPHHQLFKTLARLMHKVRKKVGNGVPTVELGRAGTSTSELQSRLSTWSVNDHGSSAIANPAFPQDSTNQALPAGSWTQTSETDLAMHFPLQDTGHGDGVVQDSSVVSPTDPAWGAWEDFVNELNANDFGTPGIFTNPFDDDWMPGMDGLS